MYRDLSCAGVHLEHVQALAQEHASTLLAYWRAGSRAATTIRSDWSILRSWFATLGKPLVIGPLRQAWPDAPPVHSRKAGSARHNNERLLSALRAQKDLTHFYVERLRQVAKLSVQEALNFTAFPDVHTLQPARKWKAATARDPDAVSCLVREIQNMLTAQGCATLRWEGLSLSQAMRRHENRLAYLRRKLADHEENLEGGP